MKKQKILVTGSSGMIGTCLCETLIKKGYNVIGVDKVKNSWNKEVDAITIKGNLLNKKTFKKYPLI